MRRLALALPAALLAALASLAPAAPAVPTCAAAGSAHAGLVVEHGDGSVVALCIALPGDSVSGEELLNLSGIAWSSRTFGGFGDAVCALGGEPAHYVDCPGKDSYWAVFVARGGGSWQLSGVGISTIVLGDGDAEGFRYLAASGVAAAPASTTRVCAAAATPTSRGSVAATTAPAPPTVGVTSTTPATATSGVDGLSAAPSAAAGTVPGTSAGASAGASAGVGATAGPAATSPQGPATPPPGGVEPGLVLAAVVGGGLAGLAILRLIAGRRPGS
jgi:hypothetical protein